MKKTYYFDQFARQALDELQQRFPQLSKSAIIKRALVLYYHLLIADLEIPMPNEQN